MFASNFMFGQGPYTPWQMAAWGMVGLIGAALGRLTRRRLGRLPLALACGLAALAATEVMNVYTWSIGASHTLAAFLLIAGASALSFDLVDAGASFLFGLAFAPELARVLERVRARMDVRWEAAGTGGPVLAIVGLVLAGALLVPFGSARAGGLRVLAAPPGSTPARAPAGFSSTAGDRAPPSASVARVEVSREIAYLASSQDANGGWGGAAGQPSSELYSAWAAIGLAAAGRSPQSVRRDGHTVLEALRAQAGTLEGAGDIERTMLALRACGAPVTSLGGRNLLAELLRYRTGEGSFSHQVNLTAFAIFALRAAGHSAADPAVRAAGAWIARQQDADGGFNFAGRSPIGGGGSSDVDDTAAAVQGMIDAGIRGGSGLARAVAFIVHAQNPDGGFPGQPGGESNAQSTAWAVQGLVAAGQNVEAVRRRGSRSPLGYLESLVAPNGSVRYSRTSAQTPVWVTAAGAHRARPRAVPDRLSVRPGRQTASLYPLEDVEHTSDGGPLPCEDSRRPGGPPSHRLRQAAERRLGACAPPLRVRWGWRRPGRSRSSSPRSTCATRWCSMTSRSSAAPAWTGSRTVCCSLLDPLLYTVWALLLVAVELLRRRPRVALAIAVVLPAAPGIAELLKPLLAHPHDSVGMQWIGPASWPSGHATAAMTLVLCALLVAPYASAAAGRGARRRLRRGGRLLAADPRVAHAQRRARRLPARRAVRLARGRRVGSGLGSASCAPGAHSGSGPGSSSLTARARMNSRSERRLR